MSENDWTEDSIMNEAADAALGKKDHTSDEDIHGKKVLKDVWVKVLGTEEIKEVKQEAVTIAQDYRRKGASSVIAIGGTARKLFDPLHEHLKEMGLEDDALKHLEGILFSMCSVMAADAVVVVLKWGEFTREKLAAVFRGVWNTIKEVTGFLWKNFVDAVKNPMFWGSLTSVIATAVGATIANPLLGAFLVGVGVGTGISVGVAAAMR